MTTTSTLLMGAGMGLGLIAAVGAQNAYVLQRSIRGDVAMVPGDLSHQLTNNGDAPTKVMLVLVRPGVPDLDVLSEEK